VDPAPERSFGAGPCSKEMKDYFDCKRRSGENYQEACMNFITALDNCQELTDKLRRTNRKMPAPTTNYHLKRIVRRVFNK